ncbi:MAG: DUF1365 domain-containing protein [Solirubrobacterales bacterium]
MNPALAPPPRPGTDHTLSPDASPTGTVDPGSPAPRSGIYEGWVSHRRTSPVEHAFRYRVFMPLLDLAELPELLDQVPLWSARRRAPARVRRSDYLGDPRVPLADAARDLVAERAGSRPAGPVLMLANPRYWGVGMNPVAFYYLYGAEPGSGIEAMIADVTNTPWGESRPYVLTADDAGGGLRGDFDKRLHVSPFMPMEQTYEWSASAPGERLGVSIRNREAGAIVFEASIALARREISPRYMSRLLLRYPPMTIATIARIYLNAAKLKLKGAPYFSHPDRNPDRHPQGGRA